MKKRAEDFYWLCLSFYEISFSLAFYINCVKSLIAYTDLVTTCTHTKRRHFMLRSLVENIIYIRNNLIAVSYKVIETTGVPPAYSSKPGSGS